MNPQIITPSRLHFGLIDLNGDLGRINGGFGVALNYPNWKITLSENKSVTPNHIKFEEKIQKLLDKMDVKYNNHNLHPHNFIIDSEMPEHVGFGSGTQFALAIARLYAEYNKINITTYDLAEIVNRGGTSGIGVAAFESGGFILDGGHSFGKDKQTDKFLPSSKSYALPPPILFRFYPPDNWHFVLITPAKFKGLSGKEELSVFQKECPIPPENAEKLSRLILMKILPSLVEKDIRIFGEGLTEMQTKFKRFGLEKYENSIVNEVINHIRKQKEIYGSGISSFGPTIFALVENHKNAEMIVNNIKNKFSKYEFLILNSTKINTSGAVIIK
jgi:beta-ribofuranosylaminobenzene 5'-phosphate synthase